MTVVHEAVGVAAEVHWSQDERQRKMFYAAISTVARTCQIKDVQPWVHDALGVMHLADTALGRETAARYVQVWMKASHPQYMGALTQGEQEILNNVTAMRTEKAKERDQEISALFGDEPAQQPALPIDAPKSDSRQGIGAGPLNEAGVHWALDTDRRDQLIAKLKQDEIDIEFARKANGLADGEPLSAFRGTGSDFYRGAKAAWQLKAIQAQKAAPEPSQPAAPEPAPEPEPVVDTPSQPERALAAPRPAAKTEAAIGVRTSRPALDTQHPLMMIKTLMGVPVADVAAALDTPYPKAAYMPISFGPMKGKSDIRFEAVRNRLDAVFGPHGIGWRLVPMAGWGSVQDERVEVVTQGRTQTLHVVTMHMFVLQYAVTRPDGGMEWIETSPLSDSDRNEDRGYAFRGAWTSLMKQAVRVLGGMNHLYQGKAPSENRQSQQDRRL